MADKSKRLTRAEQLEAELSKIHRRLRVCGHAGKSVSDLIRLAESGDKLAVALLLFITSETVGALNEIAERRPHLILPHSRNLFVWPAFISRKRAFKRDNDKLMAALQLGEGEFYSKRGWQPLAPSTQSALALLTNATVRQKDLHLPPLTKETKRRWFEASWQDFLESGIKPETSEKLARLGKSKATKTPKYCKELHKRTRDANLRAEIKARLWEAFDRAIAGQKSK